MTDTPLLEVKDFSVSFATQKKKLLAVSDVSFSLYPKETLGIVGESGSGKSALVKAIVRLLPKYTCQSQGQILYEGIHLENHSERKMKKIRGKEIGMIFQDPITSLNPTMKIGNQIIEGYRLHNPSASKQQARDYAIRLLELVGIGHATMRIDQYPHTLSGGMRQRVMIAIALAPKPKIIIADEPTTALDVTIQAQILDLMQSIKEKTGTSFILITHDMSVVAGYADRMMVMYAGRVIEKGLVDQIFSHPSHPYTKGLLNSIPRLDLDQSKPLTPIEGTPPDPTKPFVGCPFKDRCKRSLDRCGSEAPLLEEKVSGSHWTACWNPEEKGACN